MRQAREVETRHAHDDALPARRASRHDGACRARGRVQRNGTGFAPGIAAVTVPVTLGIGRQAGDQRRAGRSRWRSPRRPSPTRARERRGDDHERALRGVAGGVLDDHRDVEGARARVRVPHRGAALGRAVAVAPGDVGDRRPGVARAHARRARARRCRPSSAWRARATRGRPWSVPEATIALPSTHSASAPSAPIASCGEPTGSVSPVRTLCVVQGVAGAGRSSTSTPERCAAPVPVVSVTIAEAAVESASARLSSVVAAAGSGVARRRREAGGRPLGGAQRRCARHDRRSSRAARRRRRAPPRRAACARSRAVVSAALNAPPSGQHRGAHAPVGDAPGGVGVAGGVDREPEVGAGHGGGRVERDERSPHAGRRAHARRRGAARRRPPGPGRGRSGRRCRRAAARGAAAGRA